MNNFAKLRLAIFVGMLLVCAASERLFPRRARAVSPGPRTLANLGLGALGALATRFLMPFAAVETAYWAEGRGFGLLNLVPLPFAARFVLSLALLDALIWGQHLLFHKSPALWRLHAVHHTDLDLDASSGVRFHPAEILLSGALKAAGAALLGAHFLAVAVFEVVLFSSSIFNHSNLALPPALDRVLRLVLVTPDMHRVHHSPSLDERDSNFGFTLPWWDRLFGTYRAQPREPHETMTLGLEARGDLSLAALLGRPFRRPA